MINATGFTNSRKLLSFMLAALFVISAFMYAKPAQAASVTVVNNSDRYDVDGNPIWAQGGWVMQEGGTFYWYGMDFSVSGVKKVNVYTSTDLNHWTKHENIVDFSSINAKLDAIGDTSTIRFAHSQWVGRPFVKYNSLTGKYVMFAEWSNGDGNRNKLTLFTSDSPNGPFAYEKNISQPGGYKMGDLGSIFTDADGSTYITYTIDYNTTNGGLQISKLTPDFMNLAATTKTFVSTGPFKEATTLFKYGTKYIMMASTTNGWNSSQTWCYSADSLNGTWASPYVCATSPYSGNSFDTQIDQVLPIQGTAGTVYMYIGDRWNNKGGSTGIGRNQWYPLTFDGSGKPTINGYSQWSVDPAAGTWSPSSALDTTQSYALVNRNSGKALGIVNNAASDGGLVEQQPNTGAASQSWKLTDAGSGRYYIQNINSGKVLEISGFSTAVGTQASQWTNNGGANQQWLLVDAGGGYYKIKNVYSGKVLGMSGGSKDNGAPCIQWAETGSLNQNWSLTVVTP
ncbi:RICIN domain-containing protein [Paenibacillus sacheonensis]|uniref:Family 43 glycosylhydrolase n=1 Tax=Paenibacillus sacheonensis TaxID=742054 RepID=A0A7X4YLF4_9BACL|nr:RICIN domain-containing protein [Paenibacillus sacheonensis]MBM7564069.1 hypothetical protein [Paenibacillus sacheonensis]NBC67599.1 family 43 glycosylhydrolase [Paenibacillus sacheonensis]